MHYISLWKLKYWNIFDLQIISTIFDILFMYVCYVIWPFHSVIKYYTYTFLCLTCSISTSDFNVDLILFMSSSVEYHEVSFSYI